MISVSNEGSVGGCATSLGRTAVPGMAFLAKAEVKLATTRGLIERTESDNKLRRLCGGPSARTVPSEPPLSRALAELPSLQRLRCPAGCTKRRSSGPFV